MHGQDMPSRADAEGEAAIDALVLTLLVEARTPWSLEEVGRELADPDSATDVVHRLATAGLVHRLGKFVFPTRAGVRAAQLPLEA
jgi:predicted transcriptional regulator